MNIEEAETVTFTLGKWDVRFLEDAREIARNSKDPSKKIGCKIVRPDKSPAGEGYNGFLVG